MFCAALHDMAATQILAGKDLTLDMSLCTYLDSTFLGTIQDLAEMVDRESRQLRLQGLLPEVRAMFEELGMEGVLDHVTDEVRPLPEHMMPLDTATTNPDRQGLQMLRAHEALASLNESNLSEFSTLIEGLRKELASAESGS